MATEEEQDGVGFSNVGAAARRAVQRAAARSTGSTAGRRTSGASTLSEADRQFLTGGGGTGTATTTDDGRSSRFDLPAGRRPARPIQGWQQDLGAPAEGEMGYLFGTGTLYTGPNLVGENGQIERAPYDPSNFEEVNGELAALSRESRTTILNFLYSNGLYDTDKPPSVDGFASRDREAFQRLLFYANVNGVTWENALTLIAADPSFRSASRRQGGGGRAMPAEAEMAMVMADVTHRMLGRAPTKGEIARYIDFYRSGNLSPTSAAEAAVEKIAGPEEEAYGFAQMAQLMTRLLGG